MASISRLCWPPLKVVDGPVVVLAAEAEAVEDLLDAVIDVVGVVVAEQFVEAVVAGGEGLVLGLVGGAGQGLGGADHVVVGGEQFVAGRCAPRRRACGPERTPAAAAAGRRGRRRAGGRSPSSGRSRPARRRSRVVLPTPLGPTRPTRSPACSSKPTSSNSGPSSKPRDKLGTAQQQHG